MELIHIIALLCSSHNPNNGLHCQQYYIKCVTETYVREAKDTALIKCIKEHKL